MSRPAAGAARRVADLLAEARRAIGATDARLLLQHALGVDAAALYAHPERVPEPARIRAFRALVARRAGGEPLAYVTGRREFHGLEFRVGPAVLIPRPETELLVDLALERLPADAQADVLELGTGSGAVAVTLARLRPLARIVAVERSPQALEVARDNARRLAPEALAAGRLQLRRGEWYEPVAEERFDLVLSNPPYVTEGDPHLDELRHEPALALVAGPDGLDCLRALAAGAPPRLKPGGWLLLEHGCDQGAACRGLLEASGLDGIFTARDLAGLERVTGGRLTPGEPAR